MLDGNVIAENIEQADWEAGKILNEEGIEQADWEAGKILNEEGIEQADWEAGKIINEKGTSQYPVDSTWTSQYPVDSTWEATKVVPVYQGIDQSKLTPILTKALQEAIARIEQLEAKITTLENA
jgi:hypothetical protein